MNVFEPGTKVTHDHEDPLVLNFLDVTFDIRNNHLRYVTYRKQRNAYAYTPANSCHPDSVFNAVISTELMRIHRTCASPDDFNAQVLFFFSKLSLRGYSVDRCFRIAYKQSLNSQCKLSKSHKLMVPFKFPYSPSVHALRTSHFWNKHAHILPEAIRNGLKFVHCNTASPNLFRLRYSRFNDQSRPV